MLLTLRRMVIMTVMIIMMMMVIMTVMMMMMMISFEYATHCTLNIIVYCDSNSGLCVYASLECSISL